MCKILGSNVSRTEALEEVIAFEECILDAKSLEQRLALFLTTTQFSEPDRAVQQVIREVLKMQRVFLKELMEEMQKHLEQEEVQHPDVVAVEVSGMGAGVPVPSLGGAVAIDPIIEFNGLPMSTFR